MAPRPTLLRATRTNMTACAIVVVSDAAVDGSGTEAFGLTVQKPFWLKAQRPRST